MHGLAVYSLPPGGIHAKFCAILKIFLRLRSTPPQIIQGWMYHGNLVAIVLHIFLGARATLIWNVRQSLYDLRQEKSLTQHVIRISAKLSWVPEYILYNSHQARRQHEKFGFSGKKAAVIPNGFDAEKFSPDVARRSATREALNIPADALIVGAIGRWHPVKSLERLLRVTATLIAQGEDICVLVAGTNVLLENSAVRAHIPDEILGRYFLLGERKDVPDILRAMDIYCLCSRAEGFPNSLGEAMACGKPCITTNVGDCAVLLNGNGIVVKPESDRALLSALKRLISSRVEKRETMGANSRKHIQETYSLRSLVAAYISLYKKVLQGA